MKPTLYLMLGYPGAGKTTAAEIVARQTGAIHLASDHIRLELFPNPQFSPQEHATLYKVIDERTKKLLSQGKSVIYDANLNRYIHRQEKYDICRDTGAKAVLMWVQAPETIARRRATEQAGGDPNRPYGNLDEPTFERLVHEIEPPQDDEPHITIDGTKVTPDYIRAKLSDTL